VTTGSRGFRECCNNQRAYSIIRCITSGPYRMCRSFCAPWRDRHVTDDGVMAHSPLRRPEGKASCGRNLSGYRHLSRIKDSQDKDAASLGHAELVRTLVERRANMTLRFHKGETPLHLAARNGRLEVVKLLLSYGADRNILTNKGQTPLKLAQPRMAPEGKECERILQ
jgi:hypothetical protein